MHAVLEVVPADKILAVLFANRHEEHINGLTEASIRWHQYIFSRRTIVATNCPEVCLTIIARLGPIFRRLFQQLVDRVAIKATAHEEATNLEIVGDIT